MLTSDVEEREMGLLSDIQRMLGMGQLEDALGLVRTFLETNPGSATGWLCLGLALRKTRAHRRAIRAFDKALALERGLVDAWLGRSLCNAVVGDVAQALDDARAVLELDPKHGKAMALTTRLEARSRIEGAVAGIVKEKADPVMRFERRTAVEKVSDMQDGNGTGPKEGEGARSMSMPEKAAEGAVPKVRGDVKMEPRFIAPALSQAIVDQIEDERESLMIVVPKVHAFKTAAATLQTLTEMYEMDGVMVCVDRPSRFTAKVMKKFEGRLDLVHFIELVAGEDQATPPAGIVRCPVYDLERLIGLMNDGLQRMATRHGGEEHFMMFDDVSGLGYYHNPKALKRFFDELAEDLEEHGIMHVAVVAREEQNLLSKWTGSAFQARLSVKPVWLMPGTVDGRR